MQLQQLARQTGGSEIALCVVVAEIVHIPHIEPFLV